MKYWQRVALRNGYRFAPNIVAEVRCPVFSDRRVYVVTKCHRWATDRKHKNYVLGKINSL